MTRTADPANPLPDLDRHEIVVAAPRERVWRVLNQVAAQLGFSSRNPAALLLGTHPHRGFEVSESVPMDRVILTGRHRFSRYELCFELAETPDSEVSIGAVTHAEFPGIHGRLYRALVIESGLHAVATNQILRTLRRNALAPGQA